jgi:hypothetical protein
MPNGFRLVEVGAFDLKLISEPAKITRPSGTADSTPVMLENRLKGVGARGFEPLTSSASRKTRAML